MPLVLSKIEENIGTIIFNNAEKRNCLSKELIGETLQILDFFEKQEVRVAILRAQPGSRVWSAGHDVNELPNPKRDPLTYESPLEQLLRRVQDVPYPIIAMIEGGVWGGACDLSITCDILIGCESATFAMTPAKIGVPYNPSGLIHFLQLLGINKAKEMFFTTQPITAQDALHFGILNHLVRADELEKFTYNMAHQITNNSPLAIRAIKQQFRLLSSGSPLPAEVFEKIQALRRRVYDSEDYGEGIRSFKEKRKPIFNGR